MADKTAYLAAANNDSIQIDFNQPTTSFTSQTGTKMIKMVTTNNQPLAIHPNSLGTFGTDVSDDGKLPAQWEISKTGVLFKREPRDTSKKIWE